MSWANDEDINELLIDALKIQGAEVIAYGTLDVPATSFTITNYGRGGSRVAVGRPSGKLHVIQEFFPRRAPGISHGRGFGKVREGAEQC